MILNDSILTQRLILRHFVDGDAEDVFALMSDDYTARMAGMPVFKTIGRVERFMNAWQDDAFAITERCSDKVIGIVQTFPQWDEKELNGYYGIGYWLKEEYRGRGYMTEAVQAVKEYLLDTKRFWCDELRINVFCGNGASERVALKCGFHPRHDRYRDTVYSPYGTVESEECFSFTRGDLEWERLGRASYSTAA